MPEQEFLGELSEKTTSVTIKEFTPDGVLISYNLQGTLKGQYNAAHMETVDALFKPDGTYEFEARALDQIDDGDVVIIRVNGTGRQISPTSNALGKAEVAEHVARPVRRDLQRADWRVRRQGLRDEVVRKTKRVSALNRMARG